eukprot:318526_1
MLRRLCMRIYNRNYLFSSRLYHINYYALPKLNFSQISQVNVPTNTININTNGNTILNNFFNSVQTYPYRFALIYDNNGITYQDLYYRVLQCAYYLRDKHNIQPSDVIGCITSNRPEFVQLVLACHILNCTFLPLNPVVNPNINLEMIKNTNTKLIIYENCLPLNLNNTNLPHIALEELYTDFNNESSWIGHTNEQLNILEEICSNISNLNEFSTSNICQFMSTSGTTGKPKLITHTFNNKCIASKQYLPLFKYYKNQDIFDSYDYPSGCRILLTGSTFHVTTYNILTCSVSHGHCAVIPNKKQINNISELWKLIELNGVNASCFLSSTIYSLIKHSQSIDGNHFKCAFITGEIIPTELIRKFMKLMANGINNKYEKDLMRIINFYGSTECEVVGFSDPISINCYNDNDLYYKTMRIRKINGIELKINNDHDKELQVYTPCLMNEYKGNIEKTNEVIEMDNDKRWYLIGEQITWCDDQNQSFIINARNKDIFITDGSVCYPQTVENVLLKHDVINGAVVIGIGYKDIYIDEDLPGLDEPIAFITVDKDHYDMNEKKLIDELYEICEENLQRELGEIPFKIFVVDDIPKTPNGKVKRDELKSLAIEYFKKQQLIFSETK